MRVVAVAVIIFFAIYRPVHAQGISVADECIHNKIAAYKQGAKNTVASADEERYDVQHVHIDIELNNQSVAIAGKATTTAKVLENNFALYVLELNKLLTIDSIIFDGQKANFTRTDDIVNVFTPMLLHNGAVFSATIYYNGTPVAGTVFNFQSGMNNAEAVDWGNRVTYTLSEPYMAKDWWPCKQSLRDKIDSANIWITVPDSLKAGSNGLLQQVTALPGNKRRYEWKTNYPVAYYLLSIAVAAYDDYSFTQKLPDGKNVLVQNYIYKRPGVMDTFKKKIDTTGNMLYLYSELFGTYPFYKEKYGHCMAPLFGGMEHQTMTTLLHFNAPLVSHELAHQWFGNNVTCATWKDIWLNEGFASYAEYLFAEEFWGERGAYDYMMNVHNIVLNDTNVGGSIYLPAGDTVSPYRIFDRRLSYLKPSAVIHTLRYLINNDLVFFKILQQYQQMSASGNANTEDFKELAEQVSGLDLDKFFKQWIYGEGYPVYNIKWNYVNGKVFIRIQQETTVPASVSAYDLLLEYKFVSEIGDTTIQQWNNTAFQEFYINISSPVNALIFDPGNKILNKETLVRDYSLGVSGISTDEPFVYPNPTAGEWKVINLVAGMELTLTDLSGKVLWQKAVTDDYGVVIPATQYARGMYILQVTDKNRKITAKKLTRL